MDDTENRTLSPEFFATLVAHFLDLARDRRARIAALRQGLANGDLAKESVRELEGICHALHGSAGMFGFPEIGTVAEEAENLCQAARDGGPNRARLAEALDKLCALIDGLNAGPRAGMPS